MRGAKFGLHIADGALSIALVAMQSELFNEFKEAWHRASEAVDIIKKKVEFAITQARDQLNNATKIFEALELTLNGEFEKAEQTANSLIIEAEKLYDDYSLRQDHETEKLEVQLQALKNSAASSAVIASEAALEAAKNNDIAFRAAQAGLETVKTLEGAVYDSIGGLIKAAASLCDIRVIRLKGAISSNQEKQSAFTIYMEATLVGEDFKFDEYYTPGQTADFLERLAKKSLEYLKLT